MGAPMRARMFRRMGGGAVRTLSACAGLACAGAVCAGLGGCKSGSLSAPAPRELAPSEFVSDPIASATSVEAPERAAPRAEAGTLTLPPSGMRIGAADPAMVRRLEDLAGGVRADPGPPATIASPERGEAGGAAVSRRDVVEAKVGEVNGRAIRLSELLDELRLGPRLEQTAAEYRRDGKTRGAWVEDSRALVRKQISSLLDDELMVAEGLGALTEPQKQGLLAFIAETQKKINQQGGGSKEAAEAELRRQGLTSQKVVGEERKRALIEFQLQQVVKRVRVSLRDARLYYERHFDEFNPPATVTFRVIRVDAADEAAVERVKSGLASGVPFADLASEKINTFNRESGGKTKEAGFDGDLAKVTPFRDGTRLGALNAPARTLTKGGWSGPVELPETKNDRGRVIEQRELAWIWLDETRQVRRSFSDRDVQLEIFDRLTTAQRNKEIGAFLERLKRRASFSSLDEMAERVVDIAGERYWPLGGS